MPGKKTLIAGFVVLVVIVVLVIGAVFVYPMLTSGNSAGASDTTGSSGSTASTSSSGSTTGVLTNTGVASITVKETTAPNIPTTGVWVYISYIGGWTGRLWYAFRPAEGNLVRYSVRRGLKRHWHDPSQFYKTGQFKAHSDC